MSLVIVGSVAFDAIETPFGKREKIIGGAGSYIALSATYFSKKTNLISVVGEDFDEDYLKMLTEKNIDISGIETIKGQKSFFWSGVYNTDMNQRETITTELNALEYFDPKVPEKYQDAEFLMLGNLSPDVQLKVLERLHKRPKFIALDTMNFWMNKALDDLMKVIAEIDTIIINDEEARQLSGEYSLVKAAQKIQKMGPDYVIIKKGEHGALLFGEGEIFSAPALPLAQVYDPTGAGDCFAGGFIGYLTKADTISFETMKCAVIAGSVMASFNVQEFGTEKIQRLSKDDIQTRINRFFKLSNFKKLKF